MPRRAITDVRLYRRPALGDDAVRDLLRRVGVDPAAAEDLGGTMSLNVAVPGQGAVLRIHAPFATATWIRRLRALRAGLAAERLLVGTPRPLEGRDLVRVATGWAELESYVAHTRPPPTWASYVWMYEAMGRLHRALATTSTTKPPRPAVATYGPPRSSRRWLAMTERAALDDEARAVADHARRLLRRLERTWVPATALPDQLVHGDVRLGNVATTPAGDRPVFLDFGFAARRPRIHELAYSLLWIVLRPDDGGRPEDFRWSGVAELVDAYERGAATALGDDERAALAPYLAAVPIYFAAVAGYTPDPSATLRGEVPSLRIAEWVLDHAADLT